MEPKGKLSLAKATLVRKLHLKKHRDELGLFIAEGNRVVEQILENRRVTIEFVVVREEVEGRSGSVSVSVPVQIQIQIQMHIQMPMSMRPIIPFLMNWPLLKIPRRCSPYAVHPCRPMQETC
jgi:hypothetical protein